MRTVATSLPSSITNDAMNAHVALSLVSGTSRKPYFVKQRSLEFEGQLNCKSSILAAAHRVPSAGVQPLICCSKQSAQGACHPLNIVTPRDPGNRVFVGSAPGVRSTSLLYPGAKSSSLWSLPSHQQDVREPAEGYTIYVSKDLWSGPLRDL